MHVIDFFAESRFSLLKLFTVCNYRVFFSFCFGLSQTLDSHFLAIDSEPDRIFIRKSRTELIRV